MSSSKRSRFGENLMRVTISFAVSIVFKSNLQFFTVSFHDSEWDEPWVEHPGFS